MKTIEHAMRTSAAPLTFREAPPGREIPPRSVKEDFVVWLAAAVIGSVLGTALSAMVLKSITNGPAAVETVTEPPALDPPTVSRGFDLCQTDSGGLITCIPADHPMFRLDFPHRFNDTAILTPRGLIGPCFGM